MTLGEPAATSPRRGAVRNNVSRHFEGATVDRFTGDWVTQNATMDALLENSLCKLRARSCQLVGSDGYAAGAENLVVSNVVGEEGFGLKVRAKNKRGGPDKKASAAVEAAWKEFGKPENYTVTGDVGEHELDCISLRSIFRKGGSMVRKVRGFRDSRFRYALQGLDMDLLDPTYYESERRISMSVEKDDWGRVQRYWLLDSLPVNRWFGYESHRGRRAFAADEIVHSYIREEIDQSQGKPWLTPVISRLRQLHGYEEAEVIAARAHASKIVFFETSPESPSAGYQGEGEDDWGNIRMDGSPGSGENLPPGVSANFIDPTHPNGNYPDFRKGVLRGIAAGIITNYNTLAQDLEGVNYSSIRQGVLSERDLWKLIQRWYILKNKTPIFSDWLRFALMSGQIPGYDVTDYDRLNFPSFQGRRWGWVDPDKDSKADERRLKNRLTSHQRLARQRGEDFDEILDEVEQDAQNAEGRNMEAQMDLFLDMVPQPQTAEEDAESEVATM